MMSNATVTVVSTTTTTDDNGDSTTSTTQTQLAWALIAPRSSTERSDPHAPAVITGAALYAPFTTVIDSNDTLIVANHSPAMNGTWQVDGEPGAWSLNEWQAGVEVALKRAG
jgi:head-tail adaptor